MNVMLQVKAYVVVLAKTVWNYSSVVGTMLYLARHTCPDIAYVVATFHTILYLED
jgi:hypothetical protein